MNNQQLFESFVGGGHSKKERQEKSAPFNFMKAVDETIKQNTPNVSYTENGVFPENQGEEYEDLSGKEKRAAWTWSEGQEILVQTETFNRWCIST